MKRISISLFLVVLLITLTVSVSAAPEAPEITFQPQNYNYPEYSVATYTVKANGTNLHATWYLSYEGKTYNLSDNTNGIEPWEGYAGETYGPMEDGPNTFTWFFGGIESGLNGAEIWCVIEDGHYDVTSARAIITVQGNVMPPEILDIPVAVTVNQGDEAEIRCVAKSVGEAQLSFQWYETSNGKLQDIRAIDGEDSDYMFCDTDSVGTRYYVCCVTTDTADVGRAYSSVVSVTVKESDEPVSGNTSEPNSEPISEPTSDDASESVSESSSGTASDGSSESAQSREQSSDGSGKSAESPWWGYLLIGVGGIGVGVVISVVIIKVKKK